MREGNKLIWYYQIKKCNNPSTLFAVSEDVLKLRTGPFASPKLGQHTPVTFGIVRDGVRSSVGSRHGGVTISFMVLFGFSNTLQKIQRRKDL